MSDFAEAIISIHPRHANAIMSGAKTVEFRRRVPRLERGDCLWIYATRPVGAVIGCATIGEISVAAPLTIWRKFRKSGGIEYTEFKSYFDGADEAIAIALSSPLATAAITIEQLKNIRERFHPPQVLTRLSPAESRAIRTFIAA